ncbi:winged helix-turn-helix domain-containing protein [Novosphingobium bradum]|uniref:Winged helix-turn-helix domain-containing protein n=2 Tax=Novosphingobium bradum TaxID=1737444 RepID=A0ABV7IQV4_9SPHN
MASPGPVQSRAILGPVRLIGLRDAAYAERLAWLDQWIEADAVLPFENENLRMISQADRSFSILVLHGDDTRRMARILRDWRSLLPGKLLVACLSASTPDERADLLRSGGDFVFDISTPGPLAFAALTAGLRRRLAASAPAGAPADAVSLDAPLTRAEVAILEVLHENDGQTVPYGQILDRLGKSGTSEAVKCLQVQIQRLRRKIRSGASIENAKSQGYRGEFDRPRFA